MHYTRDSFSAFCAPRKAIRYSMNSSVPGHKSFTRTSNITSARLGERDWCMKFSPHSCKFTSVSVGSSPRSYLFTSAKGRLGIHTAPKYAKKKTIRYVTRLFRDLRGAASLAVTEIALLQPFLCVNRSPVQYDFHGGAKAIRY